MNKQANNFKIRLFSGNSGVAGHLGNTPAGVGLYYWVVSCLIIKVNMLRDDMSF